jgi:hypothetical protein
MKVSVRFVVSKQNIKVSIEVIESTAQTNAMAKILMPKYYIQIN